MKTPIEITRSVAAYHGVTEDAVLGGKPVREMTLTEMRARREAILAVIESWPEWPYPKLGGFFNMSRTAINQLVLDAGHRRNGLRQVRVTRVK